MSIDLDAIESRIATGIYGDDRLSKEERNDAFSALAEIIAEVERLREQRRIGNAEAARIYDFARDKGKALERAAVVAWLRQEAKSDKETAKQYGHAEGLAYWRGVVEVRQDSADHIERGEHRREEE